MKIAIDAMGGDNAPAEIVKGAVRASSYIESEIILVGDENKIKPLLVANTDKITILHTDEFIEMSESPSVALRKKRKASIIVAANLIKERKADALITAGNTGAFLEASVLHIGRLKSAKIKRPAISVVLPSFNKPTILLDAGANPECKPEYLVQFAKMGSTYAKHILNVENPTVGLINIGSEEHKGSSFIQSTYELLEKSNINFKGNVEPNTLMEGIVDVAVADGFVGNIILKTAEGTGGLVTKLIKQHIGKNPIAMLGAMLMSGVFKQLKKEMDHSEYGGALLFGIDGISIKAHGRSKYDAIENAIKLAERMIKKDIIKLFAEDMAEIEDDGQ